jgi:hypothetical protein
MAELSDRTNRLSEDLEACKHQLRLREDEWALSQEAAENHRVDNAHLRQQLEMLKQDKQFLTEQCSVLNDEVHSMRREIVLHQDRAVFLDEELGRHQRLQDSLDGSLGIKLDEINRLKAELDVSLLENTQNEERLSSLMTELHSKNQEIQNLQSSAGELHSRVRNIDAVEFKSASLQQELDASIEYAAELQQSLTAREHQISELQSRLDAQQLIFRDLALQSSQWQSNASRLQLQLDACQSAQHERESVVVSLRAELESHKLKLVELDASLALKADQEQQRQLHAEHLISASNEELELLRKVKAPGINPKHSDAISIVSKSSSAATSNYDLLVVLAGQVDQLTASSQRTRGQAIRLLSLLRSRNCVSSAWNSWWSTVCLQRCRALRWQIVSWSLCLKVRSRSYATLIGEIMSGRFERIQQQTCLLKSQLLQLMQEDACPTDSEGLGQSLLQNQLDLCQQQRDTALAECDAACEAAASAKSEFMKCSQLVQSYKMQVESLMEERDRQREEFMQLNRVHAALIVEYEKAAATLISNQHVVACNLELQRILASQEMSRAENATALEKTQQQLQVALNEVELSKFAKSSADGSCQAALEHLEQSVIVQSKQKERISQLTKLLNEMSAALQFSYGGTAQSRDFEDLKRSLAATVRQCEELALSSHSLRLSAHSADPTSPANCSAENTIHIMQREREPSDLVIDVKQQTQQCCSIPDCNLTELDERQVGALDDSAMSPETAAKSDGMPDFMHASSARKQPSLSHPACGAPSDSLQTVITYSASFATSPERMEFALQVGDFLFHFAICSVI